MLTNEQYAEAVAKKMGWETKWFCVCEDDISKECDEDVDGAVRCYKIFDDGSVMESNFDPATDPASANAWETWLMDNRWYVCKYRDFSSNRYICQIYDIGSGVYVSFGETPLLALKAASEKFLEENK